MDTMLILNDGTVLNGSIMPNGDDRIIFVYLKGLSLAEGFAIFSDPGRVRKITEKIDPETEREYNGFTVITAINTEFGNCNLTLRRE